ncbi:MAG: GxxExxY protein [Planctomycetota bacterium]
MANVVIVELKVLIQISDVFAAQCLSYLKVPGLSKCLM